MEAYGIKKNILLWWFNKLQSVPRISRVYEYQKDTLSDTQQIYMLAKYIALSCIIFGQNLIKNCEDGQWTLMTRLRKVLKH